MTGRDHRCPDCKDTDFNAYVTQDSLAFTIPDTNAKWHISIDKKEGGNVCKYVSHTCFQIKEKQFFSRKNSAKMFFDIRDTFDKFMISGTPISLVTRGCTQQ